MNANIQQQVDLQSFNLSEQEKLLNMYKFGQNPLPKVGVNMAEMCDKCGARFRDVTDLVAHTE